MTILNTKNKKHNGSLTINPNPVPCMRFAVFCHALELPSRKRRKDPQMASL